MKSRKNILVLPGSNWQIELVEKIRSMGHKVFVVNPFEDSPCFSFADGYLQSDIFDLPRVISYAKEKQIDAVISDECDIAMPLVAEIGQEFGLSTIDPESASLYTNKYMMREFCRNHGMKYPEYRLCNVIEDAVDLFHQIKKPLILKPLDCNASKGVFKVNSEDEIIKCFDTAMGFSRICKCVLAERFIEGVEFTIDGIKTPSAHYTLAISEKKHFTHNKSIASELLFTHKNNRFDYDELRRVNDRFVMNSQLMFGFTHAEYKYEDGDYYLIEIAARGGGNMISSLITQYMSGHDTYRYLINCALGDVLEKDFSISEKFLNRASILKFFQTPSGGGRVKKINGLDVLENESDIVKYTLNFAVGDTIEDAISDSARIGFYIVCSDTLDKLKCVVEKVEQSFEIELEK